MNISNHAWGFYVWPESDVLEKAGKDPMIRPMQMKPYIFTEIDVKNLASLGGNVVRYSFNPELFQIENPYREANRSQLKTHINWLEKERIYTILNMHLPPGLDVANDHFENKIHGSLRQQSVFESDSVFKIWRDVWQFVAEGLKDENALAGYELHNEPKLPAQADATTQDLINNYIEVIDSIRSKDPRHIVFIPEFNSREANPDEQYWDNNENKMEADNGFQGTIWERVWLELPNSIPNLAYVSHMYEPWEFTSGETSNTFDPKKVEEEIQSDINFAYIKNNKPLYVSEYGITYFQSIQSNDSERVKWINTLHQVLRENHISSTAWQYKDIINPWTKISGTFGLWYQFAETQDIREVKDKKVIYQSNNAKSGAKNSGMDAFINQFLIQNDALIEFTTANNNAVINAYTAYFKDLPLGLTSQEVNSNAYAILTKDKKLQITLNIKKSDSLNVTIHDTLGRLIYSKPAYFTEHTIILDIPEIKSISNQLVIVTIENQLSQKLFIP